MIKAFLQQAANGQSVYITDVRTAFQTQGTRPFHLHVTLYDRSVRAFALCLPETADLAEKEFVESYVYANIYNLLSALGASASTSIWTRRTGTPCLWPGTCARYSSLTCLRRPAGATASAST